MPFERVKALWHTLRFRLMLWNAGAVILTVLATLFVVREGVRLCLLDELDRRLTEDLLEIALAIEEPHAPDFEQLVLDLDRKARGHLQHGWFVRLFHADGRELWASEHAVQLRVPTDAFGDFQPATLDTHRAMQHRVRQKDGRVLIVRVGASLGFLAADMALIDRLVAGVGLSVLIVAPLGGYWLAGRATRPLNGIITTTARLRPNRLDERLMVRRTGDELDQLSRTINGFLDRIGVYIERNRDFLASSAHELRTPLAAIRSSVEVALGGDRSPHEYEELLSEVIDECTSLEVLVNQLLLLAETDAERARPADERVQLHELVRKSVEMFRGVAESREIELRADELAPAIINGQPQHLRQVLNNLLDNAVKFTPEGGRIDVRLRGRPDAKTTELTVRDSGGGIHPDDLPHIFERFYLCDKSRSRDRGGRGTGLGLSICRAIVIAHGGHIELESAPERGTTCRIVLPLALAERAVAQGADA